MKKTELKVGVEYAVHRSEKKFSLYRVPEVDRVRYEGEVTTGDAGRYLGGGQHASVTELSFKVIKPGLYSRYAEGQTIRLQSAANVWATWEAFQIDIVNHEQGQRARARRRERLEGALKALGITSNGTSYQSDTEAIPHTQLIEAAQRLCGYEPLPEIE